MNLKKPVYAAIAMLGGYVNIIWLGIVVLSVILGSFEYGMNLYISGASTLIYSAISALILKKSSENQFKIKPLILLVYLILLNALIYSVVSFKSFMLNLIYFFILTGPGTILVIISLFLKD